MKMKTINQLLTIITSFDNELEIINNCLVNKQILYQRMASRLHSINNSLSSTNLLTQLRQKSKIDKKNIYETIFPAIYQKYIPQAHQMIKEFPQIFSHCDLEDELREQQILRGAKQTVKFFQEMKLDMQKTPGRFQALFYGMTNFGTGTTVKTMVHYMLYLKSLLIFQSNQYHRKIIQEANQGKDFGCFALTQLHHGSFSRGIKTTAIYDQKNKQFIINTYGQSGMKYWIGIAQQTASISIIWAQLVVKGKQYGPHPFIVRLRNRQNHDVMPGIFLVDCGPKNSMNIIDNGGIKLVDVRVSRESLLGKLGYVDESGNYITKILSNSQRFGRFMSPLSMGRALIASSSPGASMSALAIAVRYTALRRQFKDSKSQNSSQNILLNYPLTKFRLMVPLAQAIVYFFGGFEVCVQYIENLKKLIDPSKTIVTQLHSISASLKNKSSNFTSYVLTQTRQMLGGHGYSSYSHLGYMYHDNDINLTWQGDNNMLLQQTSKTILKFVNKKFKGQIIDLSFMYEAQKQYKEDKDSLKNLTNLSIIMQTIFRNKFYMLANKLNEKNSEFDTFDQWNQLQPYYANQLALTFGDIFYLQTALKAIQKKVMPQANRQFLQQCIKLWLYSVIQKQRFGDKVLRKNIQQLIIDGCERISIDSINVLDALAPPSYVCGSPFADQNGQGMKAYITMFLTGKDVFQRKQWMKKLPVMRQKS